MLLPRRDLNLVQLQLFDEIPGLLPFVATALTESFRDGTIYAGGGQVSNNLARRSQSQIITTPDSDAGCRSRYMRRAAEIPVPLFLTFGVEGELSERYSEVVIRSCRFRRRWRLRRYDYGVAAADVVRVGLKSRIGGEQIDEADTVFFGDFA